MGQLALAGFVIFLWVRSAVSSFNRVGASPLPTVNISVPTISQDEINKRALTPTGTPWVVLEGMGGVQGDLNNNNEVYPTQTPWVITATPENTPTPTSTPWFTNMYIPPYPGIAHDPGRVYDALSYVKMSYYYPPLAYDNPAYEINCDKIDGVLECEHMASGEKVFKYVGEAVACPVEFPFGTVFEVMGGFYTCRDRGGAIVRIDEQTIWLDFLYPYMPNYKNWGDLEVAKIYYPEGYTIED